MFDWLKAKFSNQQTAYWSKSRVKSKESCDIAYMIHQLVNHERDTRGIPRLSYDHHLAFIARGHSKDMAHHNYLSHIDSRRESPTDRAFRKGYNSRGGKYSGIGENIHQNWSVGHYRSGKKYTKKLHHLAAEVVRSWMASSGHRANILNPNYTVEGMGWARAHKQANKVYVVQNFYG